MREALLDAGFQSRRDSWAGTEGIHSLVGTEGPPVLEVVKPSLDGLNFRQQAEG